MRYFVCILILQICFTKFGHSQVVVKMKREGGVSTIPCKVNGLNLNFIFDTGASDVSISMTEATFMLKNDYLQKADIFGTKKYLDAVGNINEGITINLKEIEIAGIKLYNIKASVVKNNKAPLLLGQSAIEKLGEIKLNFTSNTLTILARNNSADLKTSSNIYNVNSVIGESIKIGNLEIAQFDFPERLTWIYAMRSCESLGTGWRLPTFDELKVLFQNKYKINATGEFWYWSSSEFDVTRAYCLSFSWGGSKFDNKEYIFYVRAVKSVQ